jgi:hypothetical protein
MAKPPKKRKRGSIDGAFAWRLVEMLESPAYRALSLSAHRVMARLEIELAQHGGKAEENGKLPCTYEHFVEFGLHRHAIAPAIRELVALGFVEVSQRGCAGNAGYRQPALYRLTYRHWGSHKETTDEWRRIKTVEEAEAVAEQARSPLSGRPPKTKVQCRKPSLAPVPEAITEKDHSPVPETITTSISPGARPRLTDTLQALVTKLPWSPPRWIEITPETDLRLNRLIDASTHRPAPNDALTALEWLLLPNALPNGSARSDAVH